MLAEQAVDSLPLARLGGFLQDSVFQNFCDLPEVMAGCLCYGNTSFLLSVYFYKLTYLL